MALQPPHLSNIWQIATLSTCKPERASFSDQSTHKAIHPTPMFVDVWRWMNESMGKCTVYKSLRKCSRQYDNVYECKKILFVTLFGSRNPKNFLICCWCYTVNLLIINQCLENILCHSKHKVNAGLFWFTLFCGFTPDKSNYWLKCVTKGWKNKTWLDFHSSLLRTPTSLNYLECCHIGQKKKPQIIRRISKPSVVSSSCNRNSCTYTNKNN